jgi:cytoskeletal protein CcmA (bactofilin family)
VVHLEKFCTFAPQFLQLFLMLIQKIMAKTEEVTPNSINRICAGTEFVGNITTSTDIRIDGTVEGNILAKGKVVIGETGFVKGDISAKNADILGTTNGKTNVTDFLSLKSTAKVNGDIIVGRLLIDVGATLVGYCSMHNPAEHLRDRDKKEKERDKE